MSALIQQEVLWALQIQWKRLVNRSLCSSDLAEQLSSMLVHPLPPHWTHSSLIQCDKLAKVVNKKDNMATNLSKLKDMTGYVKMK